MTDYSNTAQVGSSEDAADEPGLKIERAARWAAAALIPLTIILGDFEFRWVDVHAREPLFFWPWFFGSVGLSVLLWFGLVGLVRGARWRRYVLALVIGPFGMLVVAAWRFRTVRHFDPVGGVVAYMLDKPLYSLELASGGADGGWLVALAAVPAVWIALAMYASDGRPLAGRGRLMWAMVVVAVPCVVWLAWPSVLENPWTPYPTDIRLFKIGQQGVRLHFDEMDPLLIEPADRQNVDLQPAHKRPSVLIILGESLRNDRTQLWGQPGRPTTPRLAEFGRSHPDEVFAFQRHTATAAATLAAGVGVLLGKYIASPVAELRHTPVAWQYAKAARMSTFVVSAQPWGWSNLKGFYINSQPPDYFYDSEKLGLEVVNDAGGDDLQAADKVAELLSTQLPRSRPFFGLFQLNATHFPQDPLDSVDWPIGDAVDKYDAAVARSDAAIGTVIDALADAGRLDSTVVLFVSDHAIELHQAAYQRDRAAIERHDPAMFQGARVSSCEPVFTRTPLMLYVPRRWHKRLNIDPEVLGQNTRRLTSHVDVLPTILDLWSMTPDDELPGHSLLEPVDPDRLVYCFPGTRLPETRGVGILADSDRYVYVRANLEHPHAYDVGDPATLEIRRLGGRLDRADLRLVGRACRDSPTAKRVLSSLSHTFDLAAPSCH